MADVRTFWVIRASAGSGKTFRLVQTYLTCCLQQESPGYFRSICALTFTNKAAQEMKERILEEVGNLAAGVGGAMEEQLVKATGLPVEVLRSRARAMQEHMLHHYEDFAVMTIDSFVHRLVRSFARDLQLDQGFQMELDEGRLLEEAVDRLLARVGRPGEEELTQLLEAFAIQQVEDERDTRIREALTQHAKLVDKEHMQPVLKELRGWTPKDFEAARRRLQMQCREEESKVKRAVLAAQNALVEQGLEVGDFSRGYIPKWLAKCVQGDMKAPSASVVAMVEGEKSPWKANTPQSTQDAIESVMPVIRDAVACWHAVYAGEGGAMLKLKNRVRQRMSLVGTLVILAEELDQIMREEAIQTFGSLNRQIADLVQTNPAPYIFERIGVRYRHIFIDEFQDTSVTQWHNLVSLYENVLSQGHDALVVGDGKQAIYRWRNGDLRQLQQLPNLVSVQAENPQVLADAEATLRRHFRAETLDHNWRTGSAIVEFNNALFEAVAKELPVDGEQVYAGAAQVPMRDFEGSVHVESMDGPNKVDRLAARQEWVLNRIRHHEDSRPLSDIAVLVRTNASGAALAEFLFSQGITPFTDESLQIGRHPMAIGVLAILRSILEPFNPKHVASFLQAFAALSEQPVDEAAIIERHTRFVEMPHTTKDGKPVKKSRIALLDVLHEVCPQLKLVENSTSPIVALMGHLIDALGWSGRFPAYAEGLLELAREVAERPAGGAGVHAFLKAWDRKGSERSIRVSPGMDAVRIMTVHKAKGLEFPVVIAPIEVTEVDAFRGEIPVSLDPQVFGVPAGLLGNHDLTETPLAHIQEEELAQTILDSLNIAYVALTRPVYALDVLLEFAKPLAELNGRDLCKTISGRIALALQSVYGDQVLQAGPLTMGKGVEPQPSASAEPLPAETQVPPILSLGAPVRELVATPRANWRDEAALSDRNFGRALHALLAEIRDVSDLETLQLKWAREKRSPGMQRVVSTIEAMVMHPHAGATFAPGADEVFLEWDWVNGQGEVERPDRVVRRGEEWSVVDFKTGDPVPTHQQQVQRYMQTLQALAPGQQVRGELIYTQTLEVVPVRLETLF